MKKCFICQKEMGNQKHIYNCAIENNIIYNKNVLKYKQICYEYSYLFTKENLLDFYEVQKFSLPDFKKRFGLDYKSTIFLLEFFDIKRRSIKDAINLPKSKELLKKTLILKYGVDNVSKSEIIKEKKRQTFIKNYGVDNIWKDAEFKKSLNDIMLSKYGKKRCVNKEKVSSSRKKWWKSLNDEEKNKHIQKWLISLFKCSSRSKLESRIKDILFNYGISYSYQYKIQRKFYDFLIGNNIILEVNGDFWHANPSFYKATDVLPFPYGKIITAEELWEKDRQKKNLAEKFNYKVVYLWEYDINKMNDKQIYEKIKSLCLL